MREECDGQKVCRITIVVDVGKDWRERQAQDGSVIRGPRPRSLAAATHLAITFVGNCNNGICRNALHLVDAAEQGEVGTKKVWSAAL